MVLQEFNRTSLRETETNSITLNKRKQTQVKNTKSGTQLKYLGGSVAVTLMNKAILYND